MKLRVALAVAAVVAGSAVMAAPASATVHEITGMLCSLKQGGGNAIFNPPGVSGQNGASHRGEANFALPLFATGFASFDPTGGPGGDALVSFDENHPASKIELTGELVEIEPGLWITDFTFTRGNWQRCFG